VLTARQLLAWNELELGPAWVSRAGRRPVAQAPNEASEARDTFDIDAGQTTRDGAADAWPDQAAGGYQPRYDADEEADDGAIAAALATVEPRRVESRRDGPAHAAPDPGQAPGPVTTPAGDSWQQVREEVANCRLCRLCEGRRHTVFGSGSERARWMLIGEAPGAEEDARGEPFVGQAGRLLDQMLAAIGLSRPDDVFITNVLKCRPPGNRNPEPLEADTCAGYLYRQIELLRPDLILLLGRFAVQSVLKTDASVAALRREVHTYRAAGGDIPVVCTYHPAYLLRNLPEKRKSWEDLCLAMEVATRQQALRSDAER
jgi:DNA polymerase